MFNWLLLNRIRRGREAEEAQGLAGRVGGGRGSLAGRVDQDKVRDFREAIRRDRWAARDEGRGRKVLILRVRWVVREADRDLREVLNGLYRRKQRILLKVNGQRELREKERSLEFLKRNPGSAGHRLLHLEVKKVRRLIPQVR